MSVRYIVDDVDAAVAFYAGRLRFDVEARPGPGFGIVSRSPLRLLLSTPSGPGGAAQAMPDGGVPEPGGWNRIRLEVDDLGGKQILLDDPSGNPIELFEPARD